jgi:glycosyltransferase involved in cell wall biosynthesis
MKVLILDASAGWGGTEVHTLALAATLAGRGHTVQIVSLGHDTDREVPPEMACRVAFSRLTLPDALNNLGFWTWRRLLGRYEADLALFPKGHVTSGSLALDLAARWCFGRYLTIEHLIGPPLDPLVRGSHCFGVVPGLGLWWYRQWLRFYVRSVGPRKVICVSEAVRNRLTEDYGFPARKVLTFRNGIDTTRFRPADAAERATLRRRWGIADNALVCGMVGRLASAKGCDVALESFRRLVAEDRMRALRLVLVGDGPMEAELRRTVAQNGLQNVVVFAGRTERPWEVYRALDVLLMPSRVEGLPLGLLEAMASGCCSVAMGVGGIPEVLSEPGLGWLVTPGDGEAFMASVRAALQAGSEKRVQIGSSARAHVQAHFRADVQFAALAAFLEEEGRLPFRSTRLVTQGQPTEARCG